MPARRRVVRSGAEPDRPALAEHGIGGNGHGMLPETNNGEVADAIIGWIAVTVR